MDLLCPVCREPYDANEFHDVVDPATGIRLTFTEATRRYRRDGCGMLFEGKPCGPVGQDGRPIRRHADVAAVLDLLGDDVDGAASLLEDLDG